MTIAGVEHMGIVSGYQATFKRDHVPVVIAHVFVHVQTLDELGEFIMNKRDKKENQENKS
jgi:hypothetical protein